ncbi:hypothetical protein BT67DRAFT_420686 [Trichocladium antarcticum]|uniref:Amidoligase enzyme n=1 Tax=Trichocladium antarcticum TaxID=1450529 RepID=A0AAN6UNN9_9PEZI|nr:hypothetical protein BT67DRAFT_420686 [Trichocladium antarcticum]
MGGNRSNTPPRQGSQQLPQRTSPDRRTVTHATPAANQGSPPHGGAPPVKHSQGEPPRHSPPRGNPVPPPPPPPPGPPAPAHVAAKPALLRPKTPPENSIGIGIETEFYLEPRKSGETYKSLQLFASAMTEKYNKRIGTPEYPKMHSLVGDLYRGPHRMRHTEWALHHDPTCETQGAPWGIELVSPILTAYKGGVWRKDVQKMWQFLVGEFRVSADESCSTHVHLSLASGFALSQLKRLAQAVIYFECAIEALMPVDRRGNEYARSNWIDNKHLAYKNLTRDQSMLAIEACKSQRDVINLMNPDQSKYFGFNFLALEKYKTVEFRRGAASTTVNHVFKWVEFAMTFLQASIQASDMGTFKKFQPTVSGLKQFFSSAELVNDAGMNQAKYTERQGHSENEKVEPTPVKLESLSKEKRAKLNKKIEADKHSKPMLDKISDATQKGLI